MSTESPYHFDHLLQVSNESLLILDFIHIFNGFPHVYSPGADNPGGQNFDVNRNLLSLLSFVTGFKKISLKSDFVQFFS